MASDCVSLTFRVASGFNPIYHIRGNSLSDLGPLSVLSATRVGRNSDSLMAEGKSFGDMPRTLIFTTQVVLKFPGSGRKQKMAIKRLKSEAQEMNLVKQYFFRNLLLNIVPI